MKSKSPLEKLPGTLLRGCKQPYQVIKEGHFLEGTGTIGNLGDLKKRGVVPNP